jgi:hypothetical protein
MGGGATLAGLRMIIVFSKSAADVAVGWSLKYLSLCLPISTTSLFCRKVLLHRLAVDHGAVGAAQVLDERVVQDRDDRRVLAETGEVVDLDVVVRLAADEGPLLGERVLLEHLPVDTQNQLGHGRYSLRVCAALPEESLEAGEPAARHAEGLRHVDEAWPRCCPGPRCRSPAWTSCCTDRLGLLLSVISVRRISSSSTMSLKPVRAEQVDVVRLRLVHVQLGLDHRVDPQGARDQILVLGQLRLPPA